MIPVMSSARAVAVTDIETRKRPRKAGTDPRVERIAASFGVRACRFDQVEPERYTSAVAKVNHEGTSLDLTDESCDPVLGLLAPVASGAVPFLKSRKT